jgi:ribosomal protein S18 acetylase RimI-like enzyme
MMPRRATLTDVAELVRVINLAYIVEADIFHGSRTTDADVRDRLVRPNAAFLVIADDGTDGAPGPLAGSVYVETSGDRGYFGMLAVDPTQQGRGIGRRLVRAAEAYSIGLGCGFMDLDVVDLRSELASFYGSLGYVVIGESSPYPHPEQTKRPVCLIKMSRTLIHNAAASP